MMRAINLATLGLVIFGGLNLGLAGAARFDLIVAVFGYGTLAWSVVQSLIGMAALWRLALLVQDASSARTQRPLRHLPEV